MNTVANTLPPIIVCIEAEAMVRAKELADAAASLVPSTAADLEAADSLFRRVDTLAKAIAAQRLELTRPIDALKARIIEVERAATAPLLAAREALGQRALACKRDLDRIAAEERAKAEAEARAKADAERKRLEAERQEIIRRQQEEHAAAKAKADEEAALFGAAPAVAVAEPPPPPPVVVVAEPVLVPVAPKLTSMRAKITKKIDVFDSARLIAAACASTPPGTLFGKPVLTLDEAAVKALLAAGCAVPGARLVEIEGVAGRGR